jgi:hypothetical protein
MGHLKRITPEVVGPVLYEEFVSLLLPKLARVCSLLKQAKVLCLQRGPYYT